MPKTNAMPLKKRRLTAKQERFAQLVASGSSKIDAQRQAFDRDDVTTNGDYVDASQLASSPMVSLRIAELERRNAAVAEIDAGYVLERVKATAEDAEREKEHSPALRGYELLGKQVGLFVERSELDVRVTHELDSVSTDDLRRILASLDEQARALEAPAEVIEGEARIVEADEDVSSSQ